jgi:hypothetical protein
MEFCVHTQVIMPTANSSASKEAVTAGHDRELSISSIHSMGNTNVVLRARDRAGQTPVEEMLERVRRAHSKSA